MYNELKQNHHKRTIFEKLMIKSRLEEGSPIYLNIYHLIGANKYIQLIGIGFFHTTLEVNQMEYSFIGTTSKSSGIFYNKVGEGLKTLKLKEKRYLGNTLYNKSIIKELIQLIVPYWLGNSYDPFLKNCNHFTMFLAEELLNTKCIVNYPCYVNRISEFATFLSLFYSPLRRLYCNIIYHEGKGKRSVIKEKRDNNNSFISNNLNIKQDKDKKQIITGNINTLGIRDDSTNCIEDNYNFSRRLESSLFLSKDFDIHKQAKKLFKDVIKKNPFLFIVNLNKEQDTLIRSLSNADKLLFIERKTIAALNLYEIILKELEKEIVVSFDFEKYYKVNLKDYPIKGNENKQKKNILFLKLKILHCMNFIFYKEELIKNSEAISNKILSLNSMDYYAIFNIAFIKFKQYRIPESCQILKNAIDNISSMEYKSIFSSFISIIDSLEL